MHDEVIVSKINSMERCIQKVYIVYDGEPDHLLDSVKQDSIVLNIQRACKAAIDLSIHINAEYHFGVPQTYKDSFDILFDKGIIDDSMKVKVKNIEGFRHLASEDCKKINLNKLKVTIENDLGDLSLLGKQILNY
ncbi:DUF86 domain-containing protein [Halobacillus sp. A1]|uniref:type VII toxin-antitoxin system HepT family RNase toxin n=1 Tax=Halobacillus sp. A1 TaxID=2880262 RepID=UPI0020A6C30F|nr:DUF86 domain-containing protein [Halobacillus sp. A1]MCP3030099.1 DUF86 domain-containing protein [Halobacillus sp. A1]